MKMQILLVWLLLLSSTKNFAQTPQGEKPVGTDKWLQSSLLKVKPFHRDWNLSGFGGNSSISGAAYDFSIGVITGSLEKAKDDFYELLREQVEKDGYVINYEEKGGQKHLLQLQ